MNVTEMRPQLLIRPARLEDLDEMMAIELVSFPTPWSERLLRTEIKRAGAIYLAAEHRGETIGYVGMWVYAGEGHICTLAVAPGWRGRGVGEVLVLIVLGEAAQRGVQSVELEYRVSNLPAESLYGKLGFRSVGRRPGYYRDTGEDAILAATDALQSSRGQEALRRQRERWEEERDFELVLEL